MPTPKRPLKVFLCHAHSDAVAVRGLYARLTRDGVDAWLDKEKLFGGQNFEYEIRKAVRESDVVIVCLSKEFNREGFRQKEVKWALDAAMNQPEGEIFIIPLRLEECETLDSLCELNWVDLFEDEGYEMLLRAFRVRANKIGATLQTKKNWLPKITQSNLKNAVAVEQKKEVALPKVEPTEKPKQERSKKDIEREAKELSDRISHVRQEMLRKHKWNNFLIAVKYRLAIIRIYRLPILSFSVALALLIFLAFYLQKNLSRLTQALDSTPNPSQVSTDDFLFTSTPTLPPTETLKTFTPIPASEILTSTFAPVPASETPIPVFMLTEFAVITPTSTLVETWLIEYRLGCSGTPKQSTWYLHPDGVLTTSAGYVGWWRIYISNNSFQAGLSSTDGANYYGSISGDKMRGDMLYPSGCWNAQRLLK